MFTAVEAFVKVWLFICQLQCISCAIFIKFKKQNKTNNHQAIRIIEMLTLSGYFWRHLVKSDGYL